MNFLLPVAAAEQPDYLATMGAARDAAQSQIQNTRENALAQLYQQQGPGIAAGDPNAINELARMDPGAAMQARSAQQGMELDQERIASIRQQSAMEARQYAASLSAEERAQKVEESRAGLIAGAAAWRAGDQAGLDRIAEQYGFQPGSLTLESYPYVASMVEGAIEGITAAEGLAAPQPQGFRPATPEEAAQYGAPGGQIDQKTGRFYPINPPSGVSATVGPDGTVQFAQGPGVQAKPLTEQQAKWSAYATRAEGANRDLDVIGERLMSLPEAALGAVPGGLGRYAQSAEYQTAENAALEFASAILRVDTGAAQTMPETQTIKQIFIPAPGDKPEVVARKKQARARAMAGMKSGMTPQQIIAVESAVDSVAAPEVAPEAAQPAGSPTMPQRLRFNPQTGELE